jgi:hypothetical protein
VKQEKRYWSWSWWVEEKSRSGGDDIEETEGTSGRRSQTRIGTPYVCLAIYNMFSFYVFVFVCFFFFFFFFALYDDWGPLLVATWHRIKFNLIPITIFGIMILMTHINVFIITYQNKLIKFLLYKK